MANFVFLLGAGYVLGIGVAMVINAFWWSWYFSLMQAITQFYIFSSFEVPLPWKTCQNTWNTDSKTAILLHCAGTWFSKVFM